MKIYKEDGAIIIDFGNDEIKCNGDVCIDIQKGLTRKDVCVKNGNWIGNENKTGVRIR